MFPIAPTVNATDNTIIIHRFDSDDSNDSVVEFRKTTIYKCKTTNLRWLDKLSGAEMK